MAKKRAAKKKVKSKEPVKYTLYFEVEVEEVESKLPILKIFQSTGFSRHPCDKVEHPVGMRGVAESYTLIEDERWFLSADLYPS